MTVGDTIAPGRDTGLLTDDFDFDLPPENIAILLTGDWFLDRCRTTINVLGDVNVSCILDGMVPPKTIASDGDGTLAAS